MRYRPPYMILYAVALHFFWGISGIINDEADQSTALSALYRLFGEWTSAVCLLVGASALIGLVFVRGPIRSLMYMLPQQTILVISAVGAIHAIAIGQFADGVERSRWFIATDQIPAVLAAIGHTASMITFVLREMSAE